LPYFPIERQVTKCPNLPSIPFDRYKECLDEQGNLVYYGDSQNPVNDGRSFQWLRSNLYSGPIASGNGETRMVDLGFNRDHTGFKLKKFSEARAKMQCDSSGEHCRTWSEPAPYVELKNWFFRDCR